MFPLIYPIVVIIIQGTDKIVGATIVADAAGEMISELTLAVQFGIGACGR